MYVSCTLTCTHVCMYVTYLSALLLGASESTGSAVPSGEGPPSLHLRHSQCCDGTAQVPEGRTGGDTWTVQGWHTIEQHTHEHTCHQTHTDHTDITYNSVILHLLNSGHIKRSSLAYISSFSDHTCWPAKLCGYFVAVTKGSVSTFSVVRIHQLPTDAIWLFLTQQVY